jgi:precorrin-3B synthase
VPDLAAELALAFVRERGMNCAAPRRMRDLLQSGPAGVRKLLAHVDPALLAPQADLSQPASRSTSILGPNRAGSLPFLGVAAPFGRLSADDLALLAKVAERFGNGELRLTPWRAVLLPGVGSPAGIAELGPGFILDEHDRRRRVAACPGANGCLNGSTPTQADATALAPLAAVLADAGIALHVSGCPKGCALPGPAPVTLVGRDGRYDLVRDGTASDRPTRFGLTLAEVATALDEMARRPVPA